MSVCMSYMCEGVFMYMYACIFGTVYIHTRTKKLASRRLASRSTIAARIIFAGIILVNFTRELRVSCLMF
jgi:hypothetical protein